MTRDPPPGRLELLAIAAVAVALRAAVFAAAVTAGRLAPARVTAQADTPSYVAYASALCGDRPFAALDEYDRRVFPGYPALIAAAHVALRLPLPTAALAVTWASAAAAAAFAAAAFGDARVGWAATCLVPHYVINSTLGMGEAPLLAATTAAVWAARRDRFATAGLLLGVGGLIRPMACFAAAGVAYAAWRAGSRPAVVRLVVAAGLTFAGGVAAVQAWTGDASAGVRIYARHPGAYNGHLLGWPFQSLLTTPLAEPTSLWRITYVWAHIAVVLMACTMILRRQFRPGWRLQPPPPPPPVDRDDLAGPWLLGNTLFILCIGSTWGFRHFPRFTIPAAPPLFWTVRRALPRRPAIWLAIGTACAAAAVSGIVHPTQ